MRTRIALLTILATALIAAPAAQRGGPPQGGFGGPGGPGSEIKLVSRFDADKDGRLNADERAKARAFLESSAAARPEGPMGRRGGGPGGPGRFGRGGPGGELPAGPAEPGPKLTAEEVKSGGDAPVYAPDVLRTFLLTFENADWEKELAAFNNTDVEVPATVVVDGRTYRDVGVHFRGQSSFFSVPEGRKRSLNLSFDFVHKDQELGGYRTFNLLNAHGDPTFLRSVLYLRIAREITRAPAANFARVVINGESWGIYTNAQQFNKDFTRDAFNTAGGARWKVPGSPGARGGLEYLGEEVEPYRRHYEIKSKDDPKSWAALIGLTRILNETPADRFERALAPVLDIDSALKFLALEIVFVNADGYWTRASDYSLFLDGSGRFHVIPHDANETFHEGGGRGRGPGGGRMGPRGDFGPPMGPPPPGMEGRAGGPMNEGGVDLDPLIGLDDATKPLRSRLLAVPALRERYIGYVRQLSDTWLDWQKLGPVVERYRALIADDVRTDTKKLGTIDGFDRGATDLKSFADRRRAFLASWGR